MAEGTRCPSCQARIVSTLATPWGDGEQKLPVAPWICSACACLGLIEIETGVITLTLDAWWEPVKAKNPVLWGEITQAIARIRARKETPHGGVDPGQ